MLHTEDTQKEKQQNNLPGRRKKRFKNTHKQYTLYTYGV